MRTSSHLGTIGIRLRRLDGAIHDRPYASFVHLSRRALDLLCFVLGACVGAVGLLIVGEAGPGSWVVAPVALGLGAVAQQRALFAPGGPFRT